MGTSRIWIDGIGIPPLTLNMNVNNETHMRVIVTWCYNLTSSFCEPYMPENVFARWIMDFHTELL